MTEFTINRKYDNDTCKKMLQLKKAGHSYRYISRECCESKDCDKTVKRIVKKMMRDYDRTVTKEIPNIVIFDVETSTHVVHTFPLRKAFISPTQIIDMAYLLSFSWKTLGENQVHNRNLTSYPEFDVNHKNDYYLVQDLWYLLDKADIIIAHNSGFDVGWANQQFVKYGMSPPSPYAVIDTLREARKMFSLGSNSLAFISEKFQLFDKKLHHRGMSLWIDCMAGKREAFAEMATYNDGDIVPLEEFYLMIRPFMKTHPNLGNWIESDDTICPSCGSNHIKKQPNKIHLTYDVYKCDNCQGFSRHCKTNKTVKTKTKLRPI